jgi:lysophospholipase L1-like esterase
MLRRFSPVLVCAAIAAGCGGSPTGPSVDGASVARLSRTRFLAFGDSMTAGEVTVPVGGLFLEPGQGLSTKQVLVPSAAYPTLLQAQMSSRYTTQASTITVTNAGKSGEHPHEGVQRFSDALAAARPEVVLLLEGANSLWLYGSDLPTLGVGNMVDAAQAAGVRVLVATLPPSLPGMRNSLPQVELLAFNRKITEMAAVKRVGVVNLYDPMLAEAATLIGSDGLHPTEAGYHRMAELFFAAIRNDLEVR